MKETKTKEQFIEKKLVEFRKIFKGIEWVKSKNGKLFCYEANIEDFLRQLLAVQKKDLLKEIEKDLLKIADEGEFEELRREVEIYFKCK